MTSIYDDEWDTAAEREDAEPLPAYTREDCIQFVKDMEAAGLVVEHYHGRFFWEGPAVIVDNLQDAMSNTKVRVQYDSMGMGFVVYPLTSDAGVTA